MIGDLQSTPMLTLRTALVTPYYALWDECLGHMVKFP
jgi:hypothetical protein